MGRSKEWIRHSYYSVLEKSTWNHFTVKAPQTSFTRTRLWPNINHAWTVRAVDTKGNPSAESNTVTFKTPPDVTAPSTPTLSPVFVGPKVVELDWTDSVDDVSHVTYTVNVDGTAVPVGNQSHAVLPLAPSSSHSISLTARNNWGNAAASNTLSLTTPAADNTSPPTAPVNLVGLEVGSCEGWLSWSANGRRRPVLGDPLRRLRQRPVRQLGLRPSVDDRVRDPERDQHVQDRRSRQLGQ